jgi:CRP-like cAMP-binding protein
MISTNTSPEKAAPMIDRSEFFSILKNVTIFSGVEETGLLNLFNKCDLIEHAAGKQLVKEGTDATEIFIILKGRVKIVIDIDANPLEIIELGPGSCVGEASVIGIQAHSASAVVTQDTTLLVLSRQVLMDVQKTDKDLFSLLILNLARELARRLHHTDHILLLYSKEHHRQP